MLSSYYMGYFAASFFHFPIKFVPNAIIILHWLFCIQFFPSPYQSCPKCYHHTTLVILHPVFSFSLSNLSQMLPPYYIAYFRASFFLFSFKFVPNGITYSKHLMLYTGRTAERPLALPGPFTSSSFCFLLTWHVFVQNSKLRLDVFK